MVPITPILKLSRIYCISAFSAMLFAVIALCLNSLPPAELAPNGESSIIYPYRLDLVLNCLAFLIVSTSIYFGLKVAGQANVDAQKTSKLLREAKRRTNEIAALYDMSQDLSVQRSLPALLHTIVERAKILLNASGCAIFLVDEARGDFEVAAEADMGIPAGMHIPLHEGIAGHVARTFEPLIVNNYSDSPYRSRILKRLAISASLCVPMVRGGELIGVLGVHEAREINRTFTQADAHLLSLFADNAAGAVSNARLLEALRSSKERFRIAAECASDMIYDWDLTGDHVKYFGTFHKVAGVAGSFLPRTRQEYWDMIHPEDRARVLGALTEHLEAGSTFSEEYRIRGEKSSYISVADRATAIRDRDGKPIKLIGAVNDITERKQSEQMRTDFVGFVTHQLRTPLSGLKWMLELAMDSTENAEEVRSCIRDARISTDRLIEMVNDLLELSRIERGRLQIMNQNIDLEQLTRGVVNEIAPLLKEKKQGISIDVDGDLPHLCADPQLLREVILNLASNALKYTPPGGAIKIRMSCGDHKAHWEIRDTGIGIPSKDLERLFEKFYRAGNAVAVETEGTGLGLYLVRLIVERLGGKVWCESEEGIGSKFQFDLPLVASCLSGCLSRPQSVACSCRTSES
jgi:PAS domain S-box-containing protein